MATILTFAISIYSTSISSMSQKPKTNQNGCSCFGCHSCPVSRLLLALTKSAAGEVLLLVGLESSGLQGLRPLRSQQGGKIPRKWWGLVLVHHTWKMSSDKWSIETLEVHWLPHPCLLCWYGGRGKTIQGFFPGWHLNG